MKNEEWYFLDNKHNLFGTFSSKELISLYLKKEVTDRNFVWRNGFGDWRRFGEIRPTLTSLDTQSNSSHIFLKTVILQIEKIVFGLILFLLPLSQKLKFQLSVLIIQNRIRSYGYRINIRLILRN